MLALQIRWLFAALRFQMFGEEPKRFLIGGLEAVGTANFYSSVVEAKGRRK
jgi:hypothetical protein